MLPSPPIIYIRGKLFPQHFPCRTKRPPPLPCTFPTLQCRRTKSYLFPFFRVVFLYTDANEDNHPAAPWRGNPPARWSISLLPVACCVRSPTCCSPPGCGHSPPGKRTKMICRTAVSPRCTTTVAPAPAAISARANSSGGS